MTDKQIIYDCPHISLTDWGTYACKLYNPRDKNCIVSGGNCDSNISCPHKQLQTKEQECERLKECLSQIQNAAISLTRQFDLLCAENEELKNFHINIVGVKKCEIRELVKYKRILTEIKTEMHKILMVGNGIDGKYRPVKNSSKQDCYQVLGKIQEILGTN